MNKKYNLTILIDLIEFCPTHGIDYRNQISNKIESYLRTDDNGERCGAGWFENKGDIQFSGISDINKAEERFSQVFDEFNAWDKLLQVNFYYNIYEDPHLEENQ